MDLKQELQKRADFFNKALKEFLKDDSPKALYDAAKHLPLAGGKRLRPVISMLSCEAVNGDLKKVMPLAVATELIHNFTLVHDDMMDNSNLRRNLPTVHVKYGGPTAILAGDLLFAKAFDAMHGFSGDLSVFKKLNHGFVKCVEQICEGQQLDMEFEKRHNVTEKEYLKMILKKTAYLFMFSAEGGAIICDGKNEEVDALKRYGESLGLAFQIHDDYLDMSSDEKILGKDIGNDIRNGKKTLIAVHALNKAGDKDKQFLKRIFGNKNASEKDVRSVFDLFKNLKSIDYAKNVAIKYNKDAKDALRVLDDSHAKEVLIELADYAISREK